MAGCGSVLTACLLGLHEAWPLLVGVYCCSLAPTHQPFQRLCALHTAMVEVQQQELSSSSSSTCRAETGLRQQQFHTRHRQTSAKYECCWANICVLFQPKHHQYCSVTEYAAASDSAILQGQHKGYQVIEEHFCDLLTTTCAVEEHRSSNTISVLGYTSEASTFGNLCTS